MMPLRGYVYRGRDTYTINRPRRHPALIAPTLSAVRTHDAPCTGVDDGVPCQFRKPEVYSRSGDKPTGESPRKEDSDGAHRIRDVECRRKPRPPWRATTKAKIPEVQIQ